MTADEAREDRRLKCIHLFGGEHQELLFAGAVQALRRAVSQDEEL